MKRRLLIRGVLLLILLTGGAIVNVAVAWGCANLLEDRTDVTRTIERHGEAPVVTQHNWPIDDLQGWPLRSLADQLPPHEYPATVTIIEFTNTKFAYGVLWPGFAINTNFYAAVLWMMFVMPFALRRRLRIRRGLCPACAYPVGSSPVCTECGGTLPLPLGEGRGEGA